MPDGIQGRRSRDGTHPALQHLNIPESRGVFRVTHKRLFESYQYELLESAAKKSEFARARWIDASNMKETTADQIIALRDAFDEARRETYYTLTTALRSIGVELDIPKGRK